MDDRRFDSLVKSLATGRSRRALFKGLLGLGGAAAIGSVALERDAGAATRPTPTPKPVKCPGKQTLSGGVCVCLSPPAPGTHTCGPDCCTGVHGDPPSPTHTECCDNACCAGTCYGEELCCPTNPGAGGASPTHRLCPGGRCIDLRVQGACCSDSECGSSNACITHSCQQGVCVSTPTNCSDGSLCTVDGCNPETGCFWTPVICDDGNICTTNTCNPSVGCVFTAIDCDDHNPCTTDTCDPILGCVHTPINCDDGNICTIDTCDPVLGCVHTPACDDGNACTEDRCDPNIGCVYTAIDCDDGDPCTIDTCDTSMGCVHTAVDCSELDDPSQCIAGMCSEGTCITQSTCASDMVCCGDGVCSERCTCLENRAHCQASEACCDGCCIINPPTFEEWIAVCQDAGLVGNAATFCAQLIVEENYPFTCLSPNQISFNAFPGVTITLPCID